MKLMFKLSILTIFFSLLFLTTPETSRAQLVAPASIDGIVFDTIPEIPNPGDLVDVSIESYALDLSASSIVWIIDGKTFKQGVGVVKIQVTAPAIGSTLSISATVQTAEGRVIQKNLILRPGTVDIVWESRGYKPPFFQGKINFSYQNKVHVSAIPHLSKDGVVEIDPKTLVYRWQLGGKDIDGGVGYGIQSVDINSGDLPKTLDISVEVKTRDASRQTRGTITLEPVAPSVTFYEESPLYGLLLNKSLANRVRLANAEMKIRAIPFGFNVSPQKELVSYVWSINNLEQPDLNYNKSVTVRTKGDVEGSSLIHVTLRNAENILQGAEGSLTVYFSKKELQPEDTTIF